MCVRESSLHSLFVAQWSQFSLMIQTRREYCYRKHHYQDMEPRCYWVIILTHDQRLSSSDTMINYWNKVFSLVTVYFSAWPSSQLPPCKPSRESHQVRYNYTNIIVWSVDSLPCLGMYRSIYSHRELNDQNYNWSSLPKYDIGAALSRCYSRISGHGSSSVLNHC